MKMVMTKEKEKVFVAQLLLIILQFRCLEGAKVLIIPFFHQSHTSIFGNLGEALSEDGHDVWILTGDRYQKQLEDHKVFPLTFKVPKVADVGERLKRDMKEDPTGHIIFEKILTDIWKEPGHYCDEVITNEQIMNRIKNIEFDLAVMDGTLTLECMYTIPYKFNIPYITVHGIQINSWASGVTGMPSIEPDIMLPFSNRMDFWERLANFQVWKAVAEGTPFMPLFDQHFLQTYVAEKPAKSFWDIMRDSEMFLLNYDVICLDYPRVSAPNFQFLGPSTLRSPKALSKDLESFVEGAEHGIVIMTFGSFDAWQYMWKILHEKTFNAFRRLKQRVIIQYNLDDNVSNVPDNVLLMKWLPQIDLLAHPKTKLFITHGGNNGQNEAVYHGVPMLVIPITVDQPYAGVRAVAKGYGLYVENKETVSSDTLYKMMEEILNNSSYKSNVQKCSKIMHSLPTAQERFVFWVNHILEFGGKHLRPPSLDMPMYQVLMVDIIAFYAGIALLIFHFTIAVIYIIFKKCKTRIKSKRE